MSAVDMESELTSHDFRPASFTVYVTKSMKFNSPFMILKDMMALCSRFAVGDPSRVTIQWCLDEQGFLLVDKKTKVSLSILGDLYRNVFGTAQLILQQDLLWGMSAKEIIASLPICSMQDSLRDLRIGFCFLNYPECKWPSQLIFHHLASNSDMASTLFTNHNSSICVNEHDARNYIKKCSELLESLLCLCHLSSGQPARATELASMMLRNTATAVRSFYIYQGKVLLMPSYNKTNSMLQSDRPIARFLPEDLGQLFVLYLSVVRPFEW